MWLPKGHLEIVKLLIANNADVNAKNSDGRTALMTASERVIWKS
jgi:ankyrin repeat protein